MRLKRWCLQFTYFKTARKYPGYVKYLNIWSSIFLGVQFPRIIKWTRHFDLLFLIHFLHLMAQNWHRLLHWHLALLSISGIIASHTLTLEFIKYAWCTLLLTGAKIMIYFCAVLYFTFHTQPENDKSLLDRTNASISTREQKIIKC